MTLQVIVNDALLDEIQRLYAPPDDPVFKLVPDEFAESVGAAYDAIDRPLVTKESFWDVYCNVLQLLNDTAPTEHLEEVLTACISSEEAAEDNDIELLAGLRDLRPGDELVGSVPQEGRRGLRVAGEQSDGELFAELTDDESSDDATGAGPSRLF